jgi:hypothetical protein
MADPVSGVSNGYAAPMYDGCDEESGMCYAQAAPAAPQSGTGGDAIDGCAPGNSVGVCADSGDYYDPTVVEAEVEADQWNSGKGPTKDMDPGYVKQQRDACINDAKTNYKVCIADKKAQAEKLCAADEFGPGYGVDNRPIEPGEEQACVDGWVWGTDGTQTTDGTNESEMESQADTNGTQKKGGGGVKIGGKLGPVTIEGNGSGEVTKQDSTTKTKGKTTGNSHADTTTKGARPGMAEECQKARTIEVAQCGKAIVIYH